MDSTTQAALLLRKQLKGEVSFSIALLYTGYWPCLGTMMVELSLNPLHRTPRCPQNLASIQWKDSQPALRTTTCSNGQSPSSGRLTLSSKSLCCSSTPDDVQG